MGNTEITDVIGMGENPASTPQDVKKRLSTI
jgi:hypothetical protein